MQSPTEFNPAQDASGQTRLKLRSVNELLKERFHVPSYQRGYRWTPKQVEALLDDIAGFQSSTQDKKSYYCLQPVVVRARQDGAWDLVDGQQRLTTIYLIMLALKHVAELLGRKCFALTYETRSVTEAFLQQPSDGAFQTIDQYHVYQAYQSVLRWFEGREGGQRLRLLDCLTGPDGEAPNVRVIWYELDGDPVKAFVRLNVGRIPLTSAELVRALLLRADGGRLEAREALQMSQDWDQIERRLHDDRYWYFLQSAESPPPSRIEYLFDVFVRN